MPQINRIRIINFSYNNDKRHIIDEKFDFYQGENALLSLTNGGGKSVLVQLMLQPIIPYARLQGRSISDFFRKRKAPAYVLVEWKLDDMGGYLLTGICLAGYEMQAGEGIEERIGIRYFTFTAKYNRSNQFDLENIPLAAKNGQMVNILPFKEAVALIAEKSHDQKQEISYFSSDEAQKYGSHLATYNISQDEWKNIIVKINDDEGGVKEIFEKCKNTQQLMNDWILKTVEKVIYRNKEDSQKLERMLENLTDEMISNEQYIYDRQLMTEFLGKMQEYSRGIKQLLEGLDEQKKLENGLLQLFAYIEDENEKKQEMYCNNNEIIVECRKELDRINLEERSLQYYECKKKYLAYKEAHDEVKRQYEEAITRQAQRRLERNIQKAAELLGHIREIDAELAGLEERIAECRQEIGRDEKIHNLEYSLKLAYEDGLKALDTTLENLIKEMDGLREVKARCSRESDEAGLEKERLGKEIAVIKHKNRHFEEEEENLKQKLGLSYTRNLFGEANPEDVKKALKALNGRLYKAEYERDQLEAAIDKIKTESARIEIKIEETRQENVKLDGKLSETVRLIAEYDEAEHKLSGIFEKHDLDYGLRFDPSYCGKSFEELLAKLEGTVFNLKKELGKKEETASMLKNGTLHVSTDFADFLKASDIEFETGETYLRNQKKEIRDRLVEGNPLLPFSFIIREEEMEQLTVIAPELEVYQPVPLITFDKLDVQLETKGKLVKKMDGISFLCLYDGRMLEASDLDSYTAQLQRESEELETRLAHYNIALKETREEYSLVARFSYNKDSRYRLEAEQNELTDRLEELGKALAKLSEQKNELLQKFNEAYRSLPEIYKGIDMAKANIDEFQQLAEKSRKYELDVKTLNVHLKKTDEIAGRLSAYKEELSRAETRLAEAGQEKKESERQRGDISRKYDSVHHAEPAALLDEPLHILEGRLEALKDRHAQDLHGLEKNRDAKKAEKKGRERDLGKLKLFEEQYADIIFMQDRLDRLDEELELLDQSTKDFAGRESESNNRMGSARSNMETAFAEVNKLGAEEPVPQETIHPDFSRRRKEAREQEDNKSKENRGIMDSIAQNEKIADRIRQLKITGKADLSGYSPSGDIKKKYGQLAEALSEKRKTNDTSSRQLHSGYIQMEHAYKEKNSNIGNIFKGLEPFKSKAELDFDGFYYFYERIERQNDALKDFIRILEAQLANLERNKSDMVQQSYMQAVQIFEEVGKISGDSAIRLSGKNKPVQMLQIEMQPLEERNTGLESMIAHINYCTERIRKDIKDGKNRDEVRKSIERLISSRELLNKISDLSNLKIKTYKIDFNMNNSEYKTWEQVLRENSGGERFVSIFSVLAALISYTRKSRMKAEGLSGRSDTKVLIMDNPFGPISSEHLLKPLFEIAKKYNTQMICLTDLKQNSILNCFNLIYMLRIRTGTLGSKEYLKFEEHIRDGADLKKDEHLERAVFRAYDYKQLQITDFLSQ